MPSPHLYFPSLEPRVVSYTWYRKAIPSEADDLDKEEREHENSMLTIRNNNKKCLIPGWIKNRPRNEDSDQECMEHDDGTDDDDEREGEDDEDDEEEDEVPVDDDEGDEDDEVEEEDVDDMEDEDDEDGEDGGNHNQHRPHDLDDEGAMFSEEESGEIQHIPEDALMIAPEDFLMNADIDMDLAEQAIYLAMGAEEYPRSHSIDEDF